MHDIAALGVFEESLFLKTEKFSVLRNRTDALPSPPLAPVLDLSPCLTPAPACDDRFRRYP